MPGTYQYEPGNIAEYGKDRMRFELGDVMVEGKEKTCALCDEEYNAVLPEKIPTTRQWKKAKLRCLESIMCKFAFEPDTKVGPLSLSMGERAKLWKEMYEENRYGRRMQNRGNLWAACGERGSGHGNWPVSHGLHEIYQGTGTEPEI